MFVLLAHPFIQSFFESDWMGKSIYLGLLALSIISWTLLIQKLFLATRAKKQAEQFASAFRRQKQNPLQVEFSSETPGPNPLFAVYQVLKKQTLEILQKNRHVAKNGYLSPSDFDYINALVGATIITEIQRIDKNSFILSTIVTLAPFMGLLGTVWGILVTFAGLQDHQAGGTNQTVLAGLSLALTTTILGLIVAIPALIGYSFAKNATKELHTQLETFSNEMVACVELQYRQVDVK